MRGEYVLENFMIQKMLGSPPHARGIQVYLPIEIGSTGITPACAGNTTICIECHLFHWDHPRMRGEYISANPKASLNLGSPPHARGIPICFPIQTVLLGITPACAGNTYVTQLKHCFLWDHPRMRGEYKGLVTELAQQRGSPPHARGIP